MTRIWKFYPRLNSEVSECTHSESSECLKSNNCKEYHFHEKKKKTRYQEIFFLYYFIFSFKGRQGLKLNTRGISVPGNKLAEGKLEIMMIMMILTYTSSSHISFMKMIRYSKNSSLDCGCPHNEIRVTAGQRFLIM